MPLVTIAEAPELDTAPDPQKLPAEDYDSDHEEDDNEDEEYSFSKFSAMHFESSASKSHITQRLRQPLLHHEDEGDALVSAARSSLFSPFSPFTHPTPLSLFIPSPILFS